MAVLAETQAILWRLITAPEGVARGIADLPAVERERWLAGGLEGLVRGDERLAAEERLDIYAGMYFFRLLDCLKEDYPAVSAVVGATEFHNLVTRYLVDHPSEHPSLRFLGRHLPRYLETHELARERPYLPGLARLEWAIVDAFDARDAEPLPVERLRELEPEAWPGARFELTPSLRVVAALGRVDEVWQAAKGGEPIVPPPPVPATFRVWRQELRVFHRLLGDAELAAIRAVEAGKRFAEVCEVAAGTAGEEQAAGESAQMLSRWFADGMVVGLEV